MVKDACITQWVRMVKNAYDDQLLRMVNVVNRC